MKVFHVSILIFIGVCASGLNAQNSIGFRIKTEIGVNNILHYSSLKRRLMDDRLSSVKYYLKPGYMMGVEFFSGKMIIGVFGQEIAEKSLELYYRGTNVTNSLVKMTEFKKASLYLMGLIINSKGPT